jgi:hypothetical protein
LEVESAVETITIGNTPTPLTVSEGLHRVIDADADGFVLGQLDVTAVGADITTPVNGGLNFTLNLDVGVGPVLSHPLVLFESTDQLRCEVGTSDLATENWRRVTATNRSQQDPDTGAVLRLARDRSIIGVLPVRPFTVEYPTRRAFLLGADRIGYNEIIVRPFVPNQTLVFDLFAHSATFPDGTRQMEVNTSDASTRLGTPGFRAWVDEGGPVGRLDLPIYMPGSQSCLRVYLKQGHGHYQSGL